MVIDLATRPISVAPDDCPSSVVVRTMASHGDGATGLLSRPSQVQRLKREDLSPEAFLTKGALTIMETRVPLPSRPVATEDPYGRPQPAMYPDPWEVATMLKDLLTGSMMTCRMTVQVYEHPSNPGLWVVTIGEDGAPVPLVRLASKAPCKVTLGKEPLPLQRMTRTTAVATVWDRLGDG